MYTSPDLVAIDAEVTYGGHTFTKGMSYGKICQYFIDTNYNGEYKLDDGQDGWYNVNLARSYMKAAITDLGASFFSSPVQVDIEYYPSSTLQAGQVQAVKKSIDEAFTIDGKQYVVVNLVEAATSDDYYNAGYYAPTGADADYDLFYGSGWGPDFGDPLTYLDTFLPDGNGYMTKVNGLW
jgi:ABC-type oligopeptide transport system substrate-binding subunit